MKKKLVASLAAAMVLGVAGTSFAAANPFVDVPAKHWAYASVMTLSQAGIVDGYGDGKFQGDKMISRYEMAQIVAKAMAKSDKADAKQKAEIEKLAAEFAEELNVIGVRVTALEKNASKIKVEGESRLRYTWNEEKVKSNDGTAAFEWRQRIHLNAQVSPNIKYTARLEALGTLGAGATTPKDAGANTVNPATASATAAFNRNFFTISNTLGLDEILVGRMPLYNGKYLATGKTSNNDGAAFNTKVGVLDVNAFWTAQQANTDYKGIYISKTNKKSDFGVGYLAADLAPANGVNAAAPKSTALDFGTWYNFAPGWNFVGEYIKTDVDGSVADGNAYAAQISYTTGKSNLKQFFSTKDIVNRANAHEQGVSVAYRSIETNGLPGKGQYSQFGSISATNFGTANQDNVKGLYVGYQNVMQKNVLLNIEYQDLKTKSTGMDLNKTATAYVQLFF